MKRAQQTINTDMFSHHTGILAKQGVRLQVIVDFPQNWIQIEQYYHKIFQLPLAYLL